MFRISALLRKILIFIYLLATPVFANVPALNIESLNIYTTSTNRNFKINLNGQTVFFRIGRNSPGEVGINRESEIEFYTIAESLGIAPKLLGYEVKNGLLITEYIEGASPSEKEIRQPYAIEKVIHNLHLIHAHQLSVPTTSPCTVFSRNNELLKTLDTAGLRDSLQEQLDNWLCVKNSIESDYYLAIPLGICHGDLFRGNILQDRNAKLFFIDWEYSYYGYVIDDIGKFCSSNWLDNNEIEFVSKMYWGVANDLLLRKLHQNIFMQQFNFFLWCQVQASNNSTESASYYELASRVGEHLNKMSKTGF